MLNLEISENAKLDIEDIFEHTIIVFGERKANQYSYNLYSKFQLIQENPNIGHIRKDIPDECLSWPYEKHFII
jgi:plasmid stabilization system protein ParE